MSTDATALYDTAVDAMRKHKAIADEIAACPPGLSTQRPHEITQSQIFATNRSVAAVKAYAEAAGIDPIDAAMAVAKAAGCLR